MLFSSSAATLPTASTPTDYAPVALRRRRTASCTASSGTARWTPVKSTAAVNDGKWHYVVLAAGASSQSLYVDGTAQRHLSGSVALRSRSDQRLVGAGYIGGSWPAEADYDKSGNTGYASYFTGDLADVAWYHAQLSAAQVSGAVERVEELRRADPGPRPRPSPTRAATR